MREHSIVRDAALRRLSRANRLIVAGSVIGAGLLTDVAANAFPGHSTVSRRTTVKQPAVAPTGVRRSTSHAASPPIADSAPASHPDAVAGTPPAAAQTPASTPAAAPVVAAQTLASTPAAAPVAAAPTPAPAPVVVSGAS